MKRVINILINGLLISVLALAGCQTEPERNHVMDDMKNVLDEGIKSNQPKNELPKSVSNALLPTIDLTKSKLPEMAGEERYDISVDDVPARQFFLSLVEGTPYNMVVHPEVTGKITVNLKNVTIPQVLQAVRDVYGYEFIRTEYGFQVLPARMQARIFQINYLNIQRTGSSSTLVSSGALTTGAVNNDQNNNNIGNRNNGPSSSVYGTEIKTQQLDSKFWVELQTSIKAIVGEGDGRNVVVNPQSGVVVVRALPSELREVETFLRTTQLIVQRQVILEAKIIEVKLNSKHQTGINWSSMLTHGNNKIIASQIGGGSVLVNESGLSNIAGMQSNLGTSSTLGDSPDLLNSTLTSAFGGVFSLALKIGDFSSFIELLKTQGVVQILSSPRVSTLNNQKAVIKVGQDEFFVTDVSTQNVTSASATTIVPDVTLTPFFSGIALDVTPQISENGEVTLHVHPSISEVKDQEKTLTIGEQTQTLPLALSNVRETDSVVRARSGQVIVIGGLMQNSVDDNRASPGDIDKVPLVGDLFKHTKNNVVKSELVILLKPVVVDGDQQWRGVMQKSAESLQNLKEQL